MDDITEKRVFDARIGARTVYLACDIGLMFLSIATERIGRFGLLERCLARDVTTIDDTILVATAEGVLLGTDDSFRLLEMEPTVAVGREDGHGVVATERGAIYTIDTDTGQLHHRGTIEGTVTALDGPFVAATTGVYRWMDGAFNSVGLGGATAVIARPIPLVGTTSGLYRLANGWVRDLEDSITAVSDPGRIDNHVLVASTDTLYSMVGDTWHRISCPIEGTITALALMDTDPVSVVACSEDGFVAVRSLESDQSWTMQSIGVDDVRALAIGA